MTVPSARATPGTLRAWRAVRLACPVPRRAVRFCSSAHLTHHVDGARLGHVVGGLAGEFRLCHGVGEARHLLQQAVEHPPLGSQHRICEPLGLVVARGVREPGQGGVGCDLLRLGRARVLGVLEHLFLVAAAPNQIERGLSQRQSLPEERTGRRPTRPAAGCCPAPARPSGARGARRGDGSPADGSLDRRGRPPLGVIAICACNWRTNASSEAWASFKDLRDLLLLLLSHQSAPR